MDSPSSLSLSPRERNRHKPPPQTANPHNSFVSLRPLSPPTSSPLAGPSLFSSHSSLSYHLIPLERVGVGQAHLRERAACRLRDGTFPITNTARSPQHGGGQQRAGGREGSLLSTSDFSELLPRPLHLQSESKWPAKSESLVVRAAGVWGHDE